MDVDSETAALHDGRTVGIRPISPSDGEALVRFHNALTSETTRLRFFVLHPHLEPSEVEYFTHVDHHDREAMVAVDGGDIIGVARFDCLPGTSDAEVAFVVADDWQGIGAGTQLLEQLVHRARAEGVTRFLAETLNENHRMQRVFRDSGLLVKSEMRSDVVRVVLDLRLELAGRHRTGLSPLQFDRNGLEVLDRDECLRLLGLATLGRIGFTSGALPSVLPVNFSLDRNRILVHTARGSRLDAALKDAVVAFEADELDPAGHRGWSVAVTGVATELDDLSLLEATDRDRAAAWAPPGHEAVLAISIDLISGRRSTTEAPRFSVGEPATP